ncbi:hypothetical protein [Methylobacterium sp. Leaf469]|uniref:hypothetical protein n=1 Tax=Methylobacterium sp. Leaf469 TaxID=1736387 RepID=UPI0012E3CBAD|nr:hypothetical protein [Methylobacterium sp. Leaf469]USU31565.1 hypothetical protein NG677_19935 [Methylobacterium sp. OTU13CASTA1]
MRAAKHRPPVRGKPGAAGQRTDRVVEHANGRRLFSIGAAKSHLLPLTQTYYEPILQIDRECAANICGPPDISTNFAAASPAFAKFVAPCPALGAGRIPF